jgi:hypothetical protein
MATQNAKKRMKRLYKNDLGKIAQMNLPFATLNLYAILCAHSPHLGCISGLLRVWRLSLMSTSPG